MQVVNGIIKGLIAVGISASSIGFETDRMGGNCPVYGEVDFKRDLRTMKENCESTVMSTVAAG